MAKNPPIAVTREQERRSWLMLQKGRSQVSIAEELAISPATVCRMIKRVNTRIAKEFTENALEIKAQQTSQLEYIAAEAMRVWQESEGEIVTKRQSVQREPVLGSDGKPKMLHGPDGEIVMGEDGEPVIETFAVSLTESTETRQQFPDPRYLAETRGALADIRKIWGLDAERGESVPLGTIQKAFIVFVDSAQEESQAHG